jgi:hypothetical protein
MNLISCFTLAGYIVSCSEPLPGVPTTFQLNDTAGARPDDIEGDDSKVIDTVAPDVTTTDESGFEESADVLSIPELPTTIVSSSGASEPGNRLDDDLGRRSGAPTRHAIDFILSIRVKEFLFGQDTPDDSRDITAVTQYRSHPDRVFSSINSFMSLGDSLIADISYHAGHADGAFLEILDFINGAVENIIGEGDDDVIVSAPRSKGWAIPFVDEFYYTLSKIYLCDKIFFLREKKCTASYLVELSERLATLALEHPQLFSHVANFASTAPAACRLNSQGFNSKFRADLRTTIGVIAKLLESVDDSFLPLFCHAAITQGRNHRCNTV